jgi:hypothetical protein
LRAERHQVGVPVGVPAGRLADEHSVTDIINALTYSVWIWRFWALIRSCDITVLDGRLQWHYITKYTETLSMVQNT